MMTLGQLLSRPLFDNRTRDIKEPVMDYLEKASQELKEWIDREIIQQAMTKWAMEDKTVSDFLLEKLQQRVAALENRLVNVASAVEILESKVGSFATMGPVTQEVNADLSAINSCGEIVTPQPEVPLLHVIDDRSLWIDEVRQELIRLKAKKQATKKQFEEEARAHQRHEGHSTVLYHEINALNEVLSMLADMVGDNPILVRRQK